MTERSYRILIIAYYYYPDSVMGAVRPSKLCKYFSVNHHVDILTVGRDVVGSCVHRNQYANQVFEIPYKRPFLSECISRLRNNALYSLLRDWRLRVKHKERKQIIGTNLPNDYSTNDDKSFLRKLSNGLLYLQRYLIDDMWYLACGREYISQHIESFTEYDAIISTFAPMSSHLLARYIKRRTPKTIWIADFRDPVVHEYDPGYFAHLYRRIMRTIENEADSITAVSDGYLEELRLKKSTRKAVITNGFDIDDYTNNNPSEKDKIVMVYTGQIYPGKQDFSSLFSALKELVDSNIIDYSKLEIRIAGASGGQLKEMAAVFCCDTMIKDFGEIDRKQAIALQQSADLLLLASWNTEKERGVIPGKFYEYMATKKPMLCFVSGGCPNSILKRWIDDRNLGFCYESINHKEDYKLLMEYLRVSYEQFISLGKINYCPDYDFIQSFSYERKSEEFISLLNQLEKG